jgi:chromatin modification-related protein VID21
LTSSQIESIRATRSQSDVVDLVKLSSPTPTKSDHNLLSDEPQTGADILSFPLPKDVSESPLLNNKTSTEESDEDNDELDLIGSSAFSTEGERRQVYTAIEQDTSLQVPHPVSTDIAEEAVIEDISMNDQEELVPESISAVELEEHVNISMVDKEELAPERISAVEPEEHVKKSPINLDDDDNMKVDPYGESSSTHSPKHESMDVSQDDIEGALQKPAMIDVPEVAGADNIPLQQPDEMPMERKGLSTIVDPLSDKKSSPSLLTPRNLPIKIDLPPIIREDIVIPIPLKPTGDQVYHIGVLAAPKSLEPPISPVHYRQQYDPQYKLPPLSVLPAEFGRKTKNTKRKKERERDKSDGKKDRDEVLPMGVSRWGATVLANPVWKRVSRATKCLSTREWGVCLYN